MEVDDQASQEWQQENPELCPNCYGDRMVDSDEGYVDCPVCGGAGYREEFLQVHD